VTLQNRQRVSAVVAIAVVEGKCDEAASATARDKTLVHLVHRHDIDIGRPERRQQLVEERRRDLEGAVRLKRGVARRPHAVERENGARARDEATGKAMHARAIQAFQPGANECGACRPHVPDLPC
jgi:hypothetical protein